MEMRVSASSAPSGSSNASTRGWLTSARQRHALLLSAGKHCRPLAALFSKPDFGKRLFGTHLRISRSTVAAETGFDVRQDPRPWQQPRLLKHHSHVLWPCFFAKTDGAGIGDFKAGDQMQQRALAATAASDYGVFLAPSVFGLVPPEQKPRMLANRRLYIIRNGKIGPEWQSVDEKVLSVTQRSLSTLIKNQGIGDLYRIYAITKRDGIDFNPASIPADFNIVSDEPFDERYMVALFDTGYQLARERYSWTKTPPGMELTAQVHN
jgi:hypothetical protein